MPPRTHLLIVTLLVALGFFAFLLGDSIYSIATHSAGYFIESIVPRLGDGTTAGAAAASQPFYTGAIFFEIFAFLGSIPLAFRSWRSGLIMIPLTLFLTFVFWFGSILSRITG